MKDIDLNPTPTPSQADVNTWHRGNQAPGAAPSNSPAAPGNAPGHNGGK